MSAATGSCRPGPEHAAAREGDTGQGSSTALVRAVEAGSNGASPPLDAPDVKRLNAAGIGAPVETVFATLNGAPVAVVPLVVYQRLVASAVGGIAPEKAPLGLSTIERDAEVAEFLRARFRGGITVAEILDACRVTFGAERTPSRQRISRYRLAYRKTR